MGAAQIKFQVPCRFCINGVAKWVCIDCGEVLPCCKCFDQGGFRRRVESSEGVHREQNQSAG